MSCKRKVQLRLEIKQGKIINRNLRLRLVLNQETLTRWVGSTGVTIPLGTRSFVPGDVKFAALHLGVQWETYGTAKAGLVREDHLRAVFGLTLNDQWFQKFKYR